MTPNKILSVFQVFVLLATSAPLPAIGQDFSQELNKPLDARQAAYLTAYTRSYDAATYKIAFIAQTASGIEQTIKLDSRFRDNATAAARYRDDAMRSTFEFVDGTRFRDGYFEAAMKDLVTMAGELPKVGKYVPVNLAGKAIESLTDLMGTPGHTPNMDPGNAIDITAWVLLAARDEQNPNHQFAKGLVEKYYKIDPQIDYNLLPEVDRARQNLNTQRKFDAIVRLLEKIDKDAAARFKAGENPEELKKTLIGKIEENLGENLNTLKSLQENRQRSLENAKQAREAATTLKATSTIFLLLGDQQGAEIFQKAADVAIAAENLSQAYAQLAAEGASTAAVAGMWVALIYVVVKFFETSKKHDQLLAVQRRLEAISRQIESMRQEMHVRFDSLERKLDINFHSIRVDLANTNLTLDRLETFLLKIANEIDQVRGEMKEGFNSLARQNLISIQNRCLGYQTSGKPFQLDETDAFECRDQFANVAVGSYSWSIQPSAFHAAPRDAKEFSDREYSALTKFLSEMDGQNFNRTVHPSNWLFGSEQFVQFFIVHPERLRIAKQSATRNADLSLDNIRTKGRDIVSSIRSLALKPTANAFELKTTVFNELLAKYRTQVEEALSVSQNMSKTSAGKGPKPAREGFNQPPLFDNNYAFLQKPVPLCPRVQIEIGEMTYWPEPTDDQSVTIKTPGNPKTERAKRLVKEEIIRSNNVKREGIANIFLRTFDPNLFKLDPSFLAFLPKSVVWASRMQEQFEHLEVTPCFSKISVPTFYANSEPLFKIHVHFEIDFYVTTGEAQYKTPPFLAARIVSDRRFEHPGYRFVYTGRGSIPLLANVWNGNIVPGWFSEWESIANHGTKYFLPAGTSPDPKLLAFEKNFALDLATRRKRALATLDQTLSTNDVSAERLLALITILGIDPLEPQAAAFASWLLSADGLSSPRELGLLAMDLNLPPQVVMATVDKKIEKAKEYIQTLSARTTLQPRTMQVEQIMNRLNRM